MTNDQNKIDFLAIGDTTIDAFIKLKDAEIQGEADDKNYKICLPFADKVPYDEVIVVNAVGNAANAAVCASRLGLKTAFVSNLGSDKEGQDCLNSLKEDGVITDYIKINEGKKTNYHYVLWYGADRTILIKHQVYPYELPEFPEPKWIYFSSVDETAFPFHFSIAEYIENHPNTKLAFQPGKFEIKLGKEKLARLYKKVDMFFCNVEEAKKILGLDNASVKELLENMREVGPKTVVITDGPKGAYAYDGEEFLFMPTYPDPKEPYDRTGAGDSFSSTVVAAIASGKNLREALAWAGINSMSVTQDVGAQRGLLKKERLEEYLKQAPEDYRAKVM